MSIRRAIFVAAFVAAIVASSSASADNGYCAGFTAGWKAAFENRHMIVQIVPICPIPPVGQDSFQGGYEAGLLRALAQIGN